VAATSQDDFHQKTNDELLFFTQNPSYYHPDLVTAAARELRRRGVAAALPAYEPAAAPDEPSYHAPSRRGLWIALGVAGLLGGAWAWSAQQQSPAATPAATAETSAAADTSLTLTTAVSSPLPNYDGTVDQCITLQLNRVPAKEKVNAQTFRQYRALTKRFWSAETLTEHILEKAQREPGNTFLPAQVEVVRNSWRDWNRALVYGYKFAPIMADHLDRMQRVAQQQQEGLEALAGTLATDHPTPDDQTSRRDADVQDLLAGLLAKSPVTQKPYQTQVRHIQL
jgi:hypothetical protein